LSPLALVLLKLAAVALPLGAVAWWLGVYPRRRLVWAALVPGLLSFGLLGAEGLVWPLGVLDVVLGLAVVADLVTLPSRRVFSVSRRTGRVVSLRKPHPVSLTLQNRTKRHFEVSVRDGVPAWLAALPDQFDFRFGGPGRTILDYELRPSRRGSFTIEDVHLRVRSRLGLWQRLLIYPVQTVIHVYPDLKQLGQYAVLARTNRLSLLGVRRTRRIGQDHEFERLRDYTIDDNYKHIDWRSTARRHKLTVRDFQSSQSQRIVFLVDCGRMMTNQAAGLTLLDHGLNAVLMLSYVALKQGDSVGLLTFSDEIHGFVPPRGGMNQMNRLLHASFDRSSRLVESRYDQAFHCLATRCRKRSLVVLITNVIDEVNAHQIERYLSNLVGRHLPLGVLLRDRRLFDAADTVMLHGKGLWAAAAAADILTWRQQVLTDLENKGVLCLDVFPEGMTAPLVNRYLEVKARHLL